MASPTGNSTNAAIAVLKELRLYKKASAGCLAMLSDIIEHEMRRQASEALAKATGFRVSNCGAIRAAIRSAPQVVKFKAAWIVGSTKLDAKQVRNALSHMCQMGELRKEVGGYYRRTQHLKK